MAATPSVMVPLGSTAPAFKLADVKTNVSVSLDQIKGKKATVIMFICNHCPYVKLLNSKIVEVANRYISEGITFVAISSNDVTQYPADGPEEMKMVAGQLSYPFPYLYDETQQVAKAYDAACTPDFFVYDHALRLAYRGQFDDARPGNGKEVSGRDLVRALDAILAGDKIIAEQHPSIGCNIKWKKS